MTEAPRDDGAPRDPVAAVTHADPYDYYARLVAERPFYHDARLGLWVASSAAAVTAVLTASACRVRPPTEPVPRALLHSPAGAIFRHLVRMTDGVAHRTTKQAVAATLDAVDVARVDRESERWAARLAQHVRSAAAPAHLTDFAFAVPVYVTGSLLGVSDDALPEVAELVRDFVRCLAPTATPEQIEQGTVAAGRLRERFHSALHGADAAPAIPGTLLGALAGEAARFASATPDVIVANAIGFLIQGHDATAALINATLLTLARMPDVRELVVETPARLGEVIVEVLRYDAPVQNTRRFVAEPVTIEGEALRVGDAILVVLAAANRDPRANAAPHRFDVARPDRQLFTFGVGPHACVGQTMAAAIARAAVARLLADGLDPARLGQHPAYSPSANCRIPLLEWGSAPDRARSTERSHA